jgi:tetratricopeptide (TPR) repeat protein
VLSVVDCLPKITDFGLAKVLTEAEAGQTRTGGVLGTPSYMAPEQARGEARHIGPAADVYALGAILYEALTGRPPFKAATVLDTLEQVRSQEPLPPGRLQPNVPRDVQTVCLKCLQKDPHRRYANAGELAEDLRRFLAGEPIKARPVGRWERLRKWARRRPAAAALVALAALSAAGLVAGALVHNALLREQVRRAEANAAEARRQQRRADSNYKEARQTLGHMLTRLGSKDLAGVPRLKELDQGLLEDALAFYQGVLKDQDDPDPAVRFDVAIASGEAARLQQQLGRDAPAAENLRRAIALLERLADAYPDNETYRARLADCYNNFGVLSAGEGRDQAKVWYQKALDLREPLAHAHPDDPGYQGALATSYHQLAQIYQFTGGPAVEFNEKALAVREPLVRRYPDNPYYAAAAAETCVQYGLCLQAARRPDRAAEVYRRGHDLLEPQVRAHPEVPEFATSLAALEANWGMLLKDTGSPESALEHYDRAVRLAEDVFRREPLLGAARETALNAHGGRAQAFMDLKSYPEALKDWDRVVELSDEAQRGERRLQRAAALIVAGQHARAGDEAEVLARSETERAKWQYNAACIYAQALRVARADAALSAAERAAVAERYATRALALLRESRAGGFFKAPEYRNLLKEDEDLEPLRGRDDFRKLAAEIEAAKE